MASTDWQEFARRWLDDDLPDPFEFLQGGEQMNVPDVTLIKAVESNTDHEPVQVEKVITGDNRIFYRLTQGGDEIVIDHGALDELLSALSTAKETFVQARLFDPDAY